MAVLNGERMHDTMERLLPGARSAALLWQGAAVLGGAALGAGQVYGGAAPFGLALVIGCPPSYCLAAALGTLAAGLAFQPMLLGVKLAVAAVAAAAVRRLIDGRPGAGAVGFRPAIHHPILTHRHPTAIIPNTIVTPAAICSKKSSGWTSTG